MFPRIPQSIPPMFTIAITLGTLGYITFYNLRWLAPSHIKHPPHFQEELPSLFIRHFVSPAF